MKLEKTAWILVIFVVVLVAAITLVSLGGISSNTATEATEATEAPVTIIEFYAEESDLITWSDPTPVEEYIVDCVLKRHDAPTYDFETPYMVLVNKVYALPENWESEVELVSATNSLGEEFIVEREALAHFEELRAALLEEGIDIELDSTYRSVDDQWTLLKEWANDPEVGLDYCKQYLAVPGFSEHHTGLAIDVFLLKDGVAVRDNEDMIAERETFAKVHARLADYGFILRYPEGKEDISGYAYEPWHFRYVGPEAAREITDLGLTLEEYLGIQ